jgi:hypothetical protein
MLTATTTTLPSPNLVCPIAFSLNSLASSPLTAKKRVRLGNVDNDDDANDDNAAADVVQAKPRLSF